MATNSLEIANDALFLLGAQPIASMGESTDRARIANAIYDRVRKHVLRDHPWNCALKRITLKAYTEPATNLTLGAGYNVVGSTITVTASGPTFGATLAEAEGKRIWGDTVSGKATITGYTSSTLVSAEVIEVFTSSSVASGAWDLYNVAPDWGFEHTMALPSDYLRSVLQDKRLTEYIYKVEGSNIVTDETDLPFVYVYNLTDTTKFDPILDRALARAMAAQMAYPITGQMKAATDMEQLYRMAISEAKTADAMEETPNKFNDDVLILVRMGMPITGFTADTVPLPASSPF